MNILFTGIGGPTPLGLARAVKDAFPDFRCIGVDASKWAPSLYQTEIFDTTYRILAADDKAYWLRIREIIDKESIDFAFVVPETEVLVWSEFAEENDLPCKSWIPDFKLAKSCFNKHTVARVLKDNGLTPETISYSEFVSGEKKMAYPFWIRVGSGAGALGALKIDSEKDLQTWLHIHDFREDFIISEFLPGRNYACKLLYNEGKLLQHASAERIDYLLSAAAPSGISGMCARGRLLNRPDLVENSILALETMAEETGSILHGIFTVDFKEDKNDEALITEINIRHVSFNYAFALGGINFAETTLRHALNLETDKECPNLFAKESYFLRGVDAPIRLIEEIE
jgi:carbamoyl-phosphate synthase large subunit